MRTPTSGQMVPVTTTPKNSVERHGNDPPTSTTENRPGKASPGLVVLRNCKLALDEGLITQAEYDEAKKTFLSSQHEQNQHEVALSINLSKKLADQKEALHALTETLRNGSHLLDQSDVADVRKQYLEAMGLAASTPDQSRTVAAAPNGGENGGKGPQPATEKSPEILALEKAAMAWRQDMIALGKGTVGPSPKDTDLSVLRKKKKKKAETKHDRARENGVVERWCANALEEDRKKRERERASNSGSPSTSNKKPADGEPLKLVTKRPRSYRPAASPGPQNKVPGWIESGGLSSKKRLNLISPAPKQDDSTKKWPKWAKIVGRRIEVKWKREDHSNHYVPGIVTSFNPATKLHHVKFDDGDNYDLNLDPFKMKHWTVFNLLPEKDLIGKRIEVLWDNPLRFFLGTITGFRAQGKTMDNGKYHIRYDDGDEDELDLL